LIIKNYLLVLASLFIVAACNQNNENPQISVAEEVPTSAPMIKRNKAPENADVYFISPTANAMVTSPVEVKFGVKNMEIVPSGQNSPLTGHHHIIINANLPNMNFPIPANENYVHFGDGSTETVLNLSQGEHTLQLILGDYLHVPHSPPVYSEQITITVK
jgi:hypothetical protein